MALSTCEARNAGGTITAQYFPLGETISGTSYPYTTDALGLTAASVVPFIQLGLIGAHPGGFNPLAHSGSMREMTNSSGVIQDQRTYDPFGSATDLQGTQVADFQYGGYYAHAASGFNLTKTRPYNPALGRFINRDVIGEKGGNNLLPILAIIPSDALIHGGRYAAITSNPLRIVGNAATRRNCKTMKTARKSILIKPHRT